MMVKFDCAKQTNTRRDRPKDFFLKLPIASVGKRPDLGFKIELALNGNSFATLALKRNAPHKPKVP